MEGKVEKKGSHCSTVYFFKLSEALSAPHT